MAWTIRALAAAFAVFYLPAFAAACGAATDCRVENGAYRVSLPEGALSGALVFAHGYRGSAAGVMENRALLDMAHGRGLAVIAPNARDEDWDLPNAPGGGGGRDEVAFLDRVVADAASRFGTAPQATWISGFSAGGMFVWNVLCRRGAEYAGYLPYSGTFWGGPPEDCPAPAPDIIHIHGTQDSMVPMAGRAIDDTRQGDLRHVLAMYRDTKGYTRTGGYRMAGLDCAGSRTQDGRVLDLCTFPGGHTLDAERLGASLDRLRDDP